MSFFKRLRRQEAGKPIVAQTINKIAEAAEWATRMRAAAPVEIKHTPAGPLIGINSYKGFLAVANGAIPARSGNQAGVGSVFVVSQQATFASGLMQTCTLTTSTIPLAVYNPSDCTTSSGNGVDSGDYCWVQQDSSGFYRVENLEGCGGGGGYSYGGYGNCDCQDGPYELEVDCGYYCAAYYSGGTTMPSEWILTLHAANQPYGYNYGYYDNCNIPCYQVNGSTITLKNSNVQPLTTTPTGPTLTSSGGTPLMPSNPFQSGPNVSYSSYSGSCTWGGQAKGCLLAELTLNGNVWQITVTDSAGCVLGIFTMPVQNFVCCGSNDYGWTPNPYNVCDFLPMLDPGPCTCCPQQPPIPCPPPSAVLCNQIGCCMEYCLNTVIVSGLWTPSPINCPPDTPGCYDINGNPCEGTLLPSGCYLYYPPPNERCGNLNGHYWMTYAGDCLWQFSGIPAFSGGGFTTAELSLSGNIWYFNVLGPDGQSATFQSTTWNCQTGISVQLNFTGGSCLGPYGSPPNPFLPAANLSIGVWV